MKSKKKEEIFSLSNSQLTSNQIEERLDSIVPASDDSHPLLRNKVKRKREEEQSDTGFYLTVRLSIKLSRRQLCLLSGVFLKEIREFGVNLSDLIVSEFLLSKLISEKLDPIMLKETKEIEISLLLQSILFGSKSITLSDQRVMLPDNVIELIDSSPFVPNKRTAGSWQNVYKIKELIEVRTVQIDTILERSSITVPYDSYCKGYGESHPSQHHKKTRISPELDAKEEPDIDKERRSSLPLTSFRFYLHYQELERLYTKKIR
jgi:hypothetical protein